MIRFQQNKLRTDFRIFKNANVHLVGEPTNQKVPADFGGHNRTLQVGNIWEHNLLNTTLLNMFQSGDRFFSSLSYFYVNFFVLNQKASGFRKGKSSIRVKWTESDKQLKDMKWCLVHYLPSSLCRFYQETPTLCLILKTVLLLEGSIQSRPFGQSPLLSGSGGDVILTSTR